MNILSLFDGMSCLQITIKELNIDYGTYYASEIDKYAIAQTQLNFPDTIQLGSVTEWKSWDIDWSNIGLIGAGSPCQGFSFAGKRLAFDDERSKLFFVFVDILNHAKKFNPDVKFLFENVNMKKSHMKVINDFLGLRGVNINSNLVSAQNRNRWYWSNIRTRKEGLFGDLITDIPQPKDQGILLRDILEDEVDEKYYLSEKILNKLQDTKTKIFTSINSKSNTKIFTSINSKSNTQRSSGHSADKKHNFQFINLEGKLKPNQDKASCFTAGGNPGSNHSDMDLICVDQRGRKSVLHKSNIRRLTPLECARLQTIPDWYKWNCSETQQYKMLGNGWTVKVIEHILKFMKP